jgi:hypothetical protein
MKKAIIFTMIVMFTLGIACPAEAANRNVRVVSYAGDVRVVPAGEEKSVECKPGLSLGAGDKITTGKKSYLEIAFDRKEKNTVKIKEKSEVIIRLGEDERIELLDGELVTRLKNLRKGEEFKVRTPGAVCGARGTGWVTKIAGKVTKITVFDGKVFMRGIKKDGTLMREEVWTEKGFKRKVRRHRQPGKKVKVPRSEILKIEKEAKLPQEVKKVLGLKPEKTDRSLRDKRLALGEKFEKASIRNSERRMAIREKRTEELIEKIRDDRIVDSTRDSVNDDEYHLKY